MLGITQALESYRENIRLFAWLIIPVGLLIILIDCGLIFTSSRIQNGIWDSLLQINTAGLLLYPIWIGALLYAVAQLEMQRKPSPRDSIIFGLKQWWKIVVLIVLLSIASAWPCITGYYHYKVSPVIIIGYYVLLILMLIRYMLVLPVMLLEKQGLIEACRRSAFLTKGRKTGLAVEFLALLVLIRVCSFMLQMLIVFVINTLVAGSFYWVMALLYGIIDPLLYALLIIWLYYAYQQCKQA